MTAIIAECISWELRRKHYISSACIKRKIEKAGCCIEKWITSAECTCLAAKALITRGRNMDHKDCKVKAIIYPHG